MRRSAGTLSQLWLWLDEFATLMQRLDARSGLRSDGGR